MFALHLRTATAPRVHTLPSNIYACTMHLHTCLCLVYPRRYSSNFTEHPHRTGSTPPSVRHNNSAKASMFFVEILLGQQEGRKEASPARSLVSKPTPAPASPRDASHTVAVPKLVVSCARKLCGRIVRGTRTGSPRREYYLCKASLISNTHPPTHRPTPNRS